jgi:phage terminase large subunit-like protein
LRLKLDKERLKSLGPVERAQAEEAIQNIEAQRLRNPLAFYEPHPKQQAFHSFQAQKKCFFGGTQSGKTTGGLADDVIQAVDRDSLPDHLLPYKKFEPPFLCRIMAESFPVLETTLIQKLQDILPLDQLVGGTWATAYDKNLRVLYFQNGSKFFFMTYEQEVRKMGGASIDRVHFDEEPPLAAYNECKFRVTAKGGDLLFTMTPIFGITWTYSQLWQKRGEEVQKDIYKGKDLDCCTVEIGDNPAMRPKDIDLALEGLSAEEKAARKEGKFIALHGLIYADYNKDVHRVPERPLPSNVNVVVGIDPGISNRTAVVWVYLTHDDKMVVFQEGYYQDMTVAQVCEEVHKTNADYGVWPLYYVIDPAARNKNHQTGRSDQMEYADHGIVTITGQNSVTAGINRIKERFQSERIFIFDSCVHLDNELQMYRWKQPPKSGEDSRQAPVKKDDHLVDALRYAVMSRPYLPEHTLHSNETQLQRAMREDQEAFSKPSEINIAQFGGVPA